MKIAFIARSSLYTSRGGDTIQVLQTARHLRELKVEVDICLADEKIHYPHYDLLHFFNLTRPADILPHLNSTSLPIVVTPLLIDYSEYDRRYRTGLSGVICRFLSAGQTEYIKTIARWLKGQQALKSIFYLLNGQRKSEKRVLGRTALLLPNSHLEYERLVHSYGAAPPFQVIPNGIDEGLFTGKGVGDKDQKTVVCAARIEGLKNQLNLIRALNHSGFQLFLIGSAASNQMDYYHQCRQEAEDNIHFVDHIPQDLLLRYYQKAKVHILPSWFETCGLSTLEAAAMGCNVVITDRGYASEYCNGHAYYCDPASPASILEAIKKASKEAPHPQLAQKIFTDFTWKNAAQKTLSAYHQIINK